MSLDLDAILVLPVLWIGIATLFHHVYGKERPGRTFAAATLVDAALATLFTAPAPWEGIAWACLILPPIAWYWYRMLGWPASRKRARPILLTMERTDNLDAFLGFSLLFATVYFTAVVGPRVRTGEGPLVALLTILLASQGMFLLSRRASAIELGEKGVFAFPYFIRWEEIDSYDWVDEPGIAFHVVKKRPSLRPGKIVFAVRLAQREALEELLERQLPQPPEPPRTG